MYEIDQGEDPQPRRSAPEQAPAPEAAAAEARLRDARPLAKARIEGAVRAQQLVDLESAALAGLCGQGLAALTRVESWDAAHGVGLLLSLAGLASAVWMWRRTRAAAEALVALPVPVDGGVLRRLDAEGSDRAEAECRRQEADLARIELQSVELDLLRRRLRIALLAAAAAALCGWMAGALGPAGAALLASAAAAAPAAVLGWRAGGGGWSAQDVLRSLAAVAVVAGLEAWWCGAPLLGAIAAMAIAGAAIWSGRRRLLSACAVEA